MAIGSGLENSYVLKPGEAAGSQEAKPEGLAGLVSNEINAPETNKGGFGAGLAYFGANIAAGAGSVFENIGTLIDTAALSLTGQGELAEYKLKKESPIEGWLNDVTEEFNPDGFAQFMGGAAQGIGQSGVYMAASFIPYAGKYISNAMIFGSAGGAALKDYVRETGELNGGTWGYAALSASLETAIENLLGYGFDKGLQSSVGTKITGNIAAKVFPKLSRNAVAKGIGAYLWNAAGEGFEEMVSEAVTPAFQLATGMKDTYDFSWGDFWYSGAVGAASAAMMGGATTAVNVSSNLRTGTRIAQNGKADMVYKAAALTTEQFANTAKMQEEIKQLKSAVADYATLENKNSATGRVLLGKMSKLMATVQTFTVVNRFSQVLQDEKAGAQYRKTWAAIVTDQLGITVTEQDLLDNTTLEGKMGAADAAACLWYGAAFNAEYEAANRGLNATAMQEGGVAMPATEQAQDAEAAPSATFGQMMAEQIEQETADVPISAEQNAGIPAPEEINPDVPVSEEQTVVPPVPEENYRTDVPIAEGQSNVPAPEVRDTILDTEAPAPDAEAPVPERTEEAPKQTKTSSAGKKTKLVESGNTYTLEEGTQALKDVIAQTKNHPGSKYWSPEALKEFFLKYPDMDYISMLREQELGADIDAEGALKEFLALYDNAEELEYLSYYVGEIYIHKDEHVEFDFHTLEKKVEAPYRKATMKFRRMIKARIAEVGAAGGNVNLGIKSGKVTLDYVKDLYAKLNTNEEMQQLADKVFLVCGELGVRFAFDNVIFNASTSKIANGATVGRNIRYKTNAFNSTAISNEEKANILLHEAIHSCVSYALELNEKGELTDGDLREACRKLTDIFNDVRNSPTLRGEYGATAVNEMVAELSNPRFVEKMKQTTLWDRIVDAICKFFGITRKTDAYTNARAVLDYMLDNVSAYDYNAYANRQDNALRANNISFTTEGADIRTEAANRRAERDAAIAEAEAGVEEDDDFNPFEDEEAPAEESPAEEVSEGQEKANEAAAESKPADPMRYDAKTQAKARKMVKDFDLLAPTIRSNILQMITDADGSNIDFGTLRALATVMSANENLLVTFAENTPTNAFVWHWTRESDEDYVGSTIVLRKQIAAKTDEAGKTVATSRQQIRRALAEELWHAVQRTRVASAVEKWVLKVYGQKAIDAEKKAYNDAWVATGREAITDDAWLTEEAYANLIARKMVTANFIDKLAAGNRSVAARIFSKVKALAQALADKDHRVDREIRDLYDLYEVALNTAINTENALGAEKKDEGATRFSIERDASGKTYVLVENEQFDLTDDPKAIAEVLSDIVRDKFTEFVKVNGQKIGINQRTANEWVKSKDAKKLLRSDRQIFIDKESTFENADEILQASRDYIGEKAKHERKDNFVEFARGVVTFKVGDRGYDADVIVGTTKSGVALLYDIVNLQKKEIVADSSDTAQDRRHDEPTTTDSIANRNAKVNPSGENNSKNVRYTVSGADTEYMAAAQAGDTEMAQRLVYEAAKREMPRTKIVDANGNPLVVYHGTDASFNIFSYEKSGKHGHGSGYGFYFSKNREIAEAYGGRLLSAFLNISKPLSDRSVTIKKAEIVALINKLADAEMQDSIDEYDNPKDAWRDSFISGYVYTYERTRSRAVNEVAMQLLQSNDTDVDIVYEIANSSGKNYNASGAKEFYSILKDATGYDGAIYSDGAEIVVFESTQIKSADPITYDDAGNIIPLSARFNTASTDIRFSPEGARGNRVYGQPQQMYTKAEITRFLQSIRETYGLENTKGKVQEAEIRAILERISKLDWQVSVDRKQFDQAVSDVAGLILADTVDYFSIEDLGRIQEWIEHELLKGTEKPSLTYMQELLDDNRRMKQFVQQAKQIIKTRDKFFTARGDVLRMAQELKRNYAKIARGAESILGDPALKQLMELMGKVARGAYLNVSRAKEVCQFFEQFLLNRGDEAKLYLGDISAKVDEAFDVTQTQAFNDARMIAEGGGSLTTLEEMRALDRVMHTIKNLYDNFDKVLYQGKKVSASEMIDNEVNGVFKRSRTMNVLDRFNAAFVTPETVAEIAEGSAKTGALRGYVRMLVTAQYSMKAQINEWSTPFDAFFHEHKKFRKALNEYSVVFEGKKISLGQAISLYELSKRSLTEASVAISSLEYKDEKGKIQKIERQYTDMPTDPDEFYAWASEKALGVRASIAKMYNGFSDEAKEYIKIVESFFNKDSTAAKREADMRILGYTNVTDGFYFPAQRTGISHSLVDAGRVLAEDAVKAYNLSFNQQTVQNTRALTLKNVNEVVNEHMKGLAYYCHMYEVESSFDRFMNINIGTRQNPITVRGALDAKWKGGTKYFSNLFIDAQGGNQRTDTFSRAMSTVRSAFAQSALGMNIKVCVTQAASYPTAYGYLDVSSLMKGIATGKNFVGGKTGEANVAEMQKYSVAARARYYKYGQSQIVLSEAVTARLLKGLEWTSWGINHVDQVTITALWAAAQYQIEKDEHLAFGTEENKVRAGELLNDIINATQPTYIASTRSAAQRNQNEIVKAFMMFSSVVMKQTSMVVSSATRLYNYRHQLAEAKKNGTSTDVTTKDVKDARVMMAKTMTALIVSNVIFVLMGMLINQGIFAKDYGKDDDESEGEALAKYFAQNFLGSMINIIPVAGTITNDILSGFDQNYFVYDNINTIVDAAGSMATAVMNAASGKEVHVSQYLRAAKSGIDALSQFAGIPTRNVFNAVTGIIKRVSPEAGADIDNAFWGGASSDMASAIRNGDEKMAGKLIDIVTREKTGDGDRTVANELARLYIGQTLEGGSYDNVVRSIGTTYTDKDGAEQTITADQRKQITALYGKATATVAKLIASPAYNALDDAQKATAIGKVYDATLKNAKHTVLGTSANGAAYGSVITTDASEYYAALAVLPTLTTTGKQTKKAAAMQYLNGRGISYFEKMLILWVSGYRGEETRKFLAAQIRRTGDEEKIAAAKEMGIIQ